MMGASSYITRTELIRRKATGDVPEVDPMTQDRFHRGHVAEAAAREHLEAELGEELYPTTATDDDGYLLASFDGITMSGETGFEHKLWSEVLAAHVRAGELEPMYYWQLEQQLLVGGLDSWLTGGTPVPRYSPSASRRRFPAPSLRSETVCLTRSRMSNLMGRPS